MVFILTELIIGLLFLGVYFISDTLITGKKLKRNQMLWDEYSKGMTHEQKLNCFCDWLEENKLKHGDKFYYIPKIEN